MALINRRDEMDIRLHNDGRVRPSFLPLHHHHLLPRAEIGVRLTECIAGTGGAAFLNGGDDGVLLRR